jgi:hypothetical protein
MPRRRRRPIFLVVGRQDDEGNRLKRVLVFRRDEDRHVKQTEETSAVPRVITGKHVVVSLEHVPRDPLDGCAFPFGSVAQELAEHRFAFLGIAGDSDVPKELRDREALLRLGFAPVRRIEERLRKVEELLRRTPPGILLPEVVLGEGELLARDAGTRHKPRACGRLCQAALLVLLAAPARTGIVAPDLLADNLDGGWITRRRSRRPIPVKRINMLAETIGQRSAQRLVCAHELGQPHDAHGTVVVGFEALDGALKDRQSALVSVVRKTDRTQRLIAVEEIAEAS